MTFWGICLPGQSGVWGTKKHFQAKGAQGKVPVPKIVSPSLLLSHHFTRGSSSSYALRSPSNAITGHSCRYGCEKFLECNVTSLYMILRLGSQGFSAKYGRLQNTPVQWWGFHVTLLPLEHLLLRLIITLLSVYMLTSC